MGLIDVLLTLVVVGALVWCLEQLHLPDPFPTLIRVIAVIFVIAYILRGTGLLHHADIHV